MVKWINYVKLETDLSVFESEYNVSIPDSLKQLLLKYNKGMPRPNIVQLPTGKSAIFERLLSFNKDELMSAYFYMSNFGKKKGFIPFGITANNSLICINDESVFLFNVEHDATMKLTRSFSEFISLLEN